MVKPISVKELRTNFPKIAKELESGKDFLLIRRSKPIAEILSIKEYSTETNSRSSLLDILIKPPRGILIYTKKSAADLVRSERT